MGGCRCASAPRDSRQCQATAGGARELGDDAQVIAARFARWASLRFIYSAGRGVYCNLSMAGRNDSPMRVYVLAALCVVRFIYLA